MPQEEALEKEKRKKGKKTKKKKKKSDAKVHVLCEFIRIIQNR